MHFKRRMWIIGIGMALVLSACDKGQIFHRLRPDSVILAFGDGLTLGNGVEPGLSYPAQLEDLIARTVVNAGVAGEGSAEGVRRLPAALAEHAPDIVILGYGGSAPGRNHDQKMLVDDLRLMFKVVNKKGIPVMVIAVPHPGTEADGVDLYAGMAEELKIPLVRATEDALSSDPQSQDDQAQRRAYGFRNLAKAVADKLYELRAI